MRGCDGAAGKERIIKIPDAGYRMYGFRDLVSCICFIAAKEL